MVQIEIPDDLLPYLAYMPDETIGEMFISFLRKAIDTRGFTEEEDSSDTMLKEIKALLSEGKGVMRATREISTPREETFKNVEYTKSVASSDIVTTLEEDFLADIMK